MTGSAATPRPSRAPWPRRHTSRGSRSSTTGSITCFLEPRAALAEWDAGTGRYTLHASLQSVHALAANLARILGVAAERVRCVTGDVGGGFGSKIQTYPEYVALAWAARRLGRPVKWVSSRTEGFLTDAQSRDHVLVGELALDAAGRIAALRVHSTSNLGAYVAPCIPISTLTNMERMISGLYAIPAIHLRVEGALTTTVPINVYRGVGRLECVYTVERLVERAARETGRDPTVLRRANMVRAFPYRTATGAVYDSGDYVARLDEVIERADVAGFPARRAEAAQRGKLRGLGVGPYVEGTGGVPQEYCARCACCPRAWSRFPSAASRRDRATRPSSPRSSPSGSGCPTSRCSIVMGDTDRVAKGVGTFASRSMVRAGSAAVEAVDALVASGKAMAAHLLEAAAADIEYARRRVPRRRHRSVDRHLRGRARRRGGRAAAGPRHRARPPPRCTRTQRSPSPTAARCASWRSTPRPARSRSSR